jgi:hypothetical protein
MQTQTGATVIPQIDVQHGYAVQQVAYHVEVKDAEEHGALDRVGAVLLSICSWM